MAEREDSWRRLETVLNRLERAATAVAETGRSERGETAILAEERVTLAGERDVLFQEKNALMQECESLRAKLATAQQEVTALRGQLVETKRDRAVAREAAKQVSGRLDGAIDQLKLVLEN